MTQIHRDVLAKRTGELRLEVEKVVTLTSCDFDEVNVVSTKCPRDIVKQFLLHGESVNPKRPTTPVALEERMRRIEKLWIRGDVRSDILTRNVLPVLSWARILVIWAFVAVLFKVFRKSGDRNHYGTIAALLISLDAALLKVSIHGLNKADSCNSNGI